MKVMWLMTLFEAFALLIATNWLDVHPANSVFTVRFDLPKYHKLNANWTNVCHRNHMKLWKKSNPKSLVHLYTSIGGQMFVVIKCHFIHLTWINWMPKSFRAMKRARLLWLLNQVLSIDRLCLTIPSSLEWKNKFHCLKCSICAWFKRREKKTTIVAIWTSLISFYRMFSGLMPYSQ